MGLQLQLIAMNSELWFKGIPINIYNMHTSHVVKCWNGTLSLKEPKVMTTFLGSKMATYRKIFSTASNKSPSGLCNWRRAFQLWWQLCYVVGMLVCVGATAGFSLLCSNSGCQWVTCFLMSLSSTHKRFIFFSFSLNLVNPKSCHSMVFRQKGDIQICFWLPWSASVSTPDCVSRPRNLNFK